MRFVIACGGTGGHLFPGIAVAEVLRSQGHEVLLFISEKEVDERALQSHPEIQREKLPSIGLPAIFSPAIIGFLQRMRLSLRKCRMSYKAKPPDAVLGMGGFTSIAPLIAAWRRGIPAYLHESNAYPGKANRLAARFCKKVFLGVGECARLFPKRTTLVTGTPIRSELTGEALSAEEARRKLGLDPHCRTLLVMGGSQGAAGINFLMSKAAAHLVSQKMQVIHLTGERNEEAVQQAYDAVEIPAVVMPFCDRMQEVYPAADLVVSRSGAASLGELSWFGLPALLIPYPYAAENHQKLNADIFERAGAAKQLAERGATGEALAAAILELFDSEEMLAKMSAASHGILPRDAAVRVAAALQEGVR